MDSTASTTNSGENAGQAHLLRGRNKIAAAALVCAAAVSPLLAAAPAYAASNAGHTDKPAPTAASTVSVKVRMTNDTGCDMSRVSAGLSSGVWNTFPPETIKKHNNDGNWMAESNGFMTGVVGEVRYVTFNCDQTLLNHRFVEANWSVPFANSNSVNTVGTDPLFWYQSAWITGGYHPSAGFFFA